MKYHSKIGVLWILACLLMIWASWQIVWSTGIDLGSWEFWMVVIIFVPCDLMFINVTVDNYAMFHDDYLQVKCGIFCNVEIPYTAIVRFKETRSLISSVGLSTDRLSILFKAQNGGNGNDEVLISPVKKQEFIKMLEEKTRITVTKKKTHSSSHN